MNDYNMRGRGSNRGPGGFGQSRDMYRSDPMLRKNRRSGGSYADSSLGRLDPLSVQAQVIVIDPERRARDYAEMFLSKLKRTGLICDIIILDKFTSPSQVIDDATARGLLYTASVNLQNEMHQSITINILQGQPQEHRNMPYEDALKLVSRHFGAHLLKLAGSKAEPVAAPMVPGQHDKDNVEEIEPALSLLLINLAEGKNLRLAELDKVIDFLKKKREKLTPPSELSQPIPTTYQQKQIDKKLANAPKPVQPPGHAIPTVSTQQAEDLQAKITKLFGNSNKQQSTVKPSVSTVNVSSYSSSGNYTTSSQLDQKKKAVGIDFNNPTVQNALQNLMKTGPGNILDSLRHNSSASTAPQTSTYGSVSNSHASQSSSNYQTNVNEDHGNGVRPKKRAKPGRHAIAGFY